MRSRLNRAISRAKHAAIFAAVGAAIGGFFGRNTASSGAAIGALIGATLGEKRASFDEKRETEGTMANKIARRATELKSARSTGLQTSEQ